MSLSAKLAAEKHSKPKAGKNSGHHEGHAGHSAHVHGSAKLTVALDTPMKGTLLLESPGESIIGFEHEAKKAADKKEQERALSLLKENVASLFSFSSAANCTLKALRVEIEKEDHGEHSEVEAEYSLNCEKSISGTEMNVALGAKFPQVKTLEVQVLGAASQTSVKLARAKGTVRLP